MKTSAQKQLQKISDSGYLCTSDGLVVSPNNHLMTLRENEKGYLTFRYANDRVKVHRLQAYQLFGEALFAPGILVRHLDGNKKNNHADNIAIGTSSDNQLDIPEEQRVARASYVGKASAKKTRKIPEDLYNEIFAMYAECGSKIATCRYYAEKLDCHTSAIHKFLSGKTYK